MNTLLIVTDAWTPQTNGVVTTLEAVLHELPALGWQPLVIEPGQFRTWPLPSYPEIRIVREPWRLAARLDALLPDAVHVATEGPLGVAARRWLVRRGVPFSTAVHTKFPEYAQARWGVSPALGYRYLRWFHGAAASTLCTTESHREELARNGLTRLVVWGRGVDTARFRPAASRSPRARPRLLYVGRVAVEKNLEAFLGLSIDADKVVVGDGPARAALQRAYPGACWRGLLKGAALVAEYAEADCFVFPSRTDTFGLVMLEAMACGTPVAGHPVTGPKDVVVEGVNGALDEDLAAAVGRALAVDRAACRRHAESLSWRRIAARLVQCVACQDAQPNDVPGSASAATGATSRRAWSA